MREVIKDKLRAGMIAQVVEDDHRGSMFLAEGKGVLYQEEMGHMGFTEDELLDALEKCEKDGLLIGWGHEEFWMWK